MPAFTVRPYEAADRARVRYICWATGYLGDPVGWLWRDVESFADVFTGYYTDAEPESALVAQRDGEVLGYLLGCVDSRAAWDPGRVLARHATRRALLLRPGTAGVLWRSFGDVAADLMRERQRPPAPFRDPRWPAHLHIDLLPALQGIGAGRALMSTWLDRLSSSGVPGCHLERLAENHRAGSFFRSVGFERHGDLVPVPGFRSRLGYRLHMETMVLSIPG